MTVEDRQGNGKVLTLWTRSSVATAAGSAYNLRPPGMSSARTTEILPTHTPALFQAAVKRAADLLRAGEVVVLPTETVYGLAANALNPTAVQRIYEIKGRPSHNPIIVHVAGRVMAQECAAHWPKEAEQLAEAFWPGPLTIVLPRKPVVPDIVTAGGDTVGLRWPSHPFIQEVIKLCGFPLAAPSANLSNQLSPTNAQHVAKQLAGKVQLIVDGGQAQVGIESTVIDLVSQPPRVLRHGMIHSESLLAVTGALAGEKAMVSGEVLRSPGMLQKHYSPKARLIISEWTDAAQLLGDLAGAKAHLPTTHVISHTRIPLHADLANVSVIPHDAEAFARAIYGELHRCDEEGASLIVVEAVPPTAEWQGIADRLRRASVPA
ncbi:MAG TPA: L-threonylcarbamoyladenylate synthase [Verrucomicrobiae bacterium]